MHRFILLTICFTAFYSCSNTPDSAANSQDATTSLVKTPPPEGEGQQCFEFKNPTDKKDGAELTFLREGTDVHGNLQLKNGAEGIFHGTMERDVAFCEWWSQKNGKTQKLKFQLTAPVWNGNNDVTLVFDEEEDDLRQLKRTPCKGGKHL
ncbi:MAG: hypothetical protein RI894_1938 [Bacteroidota bacterium]|jgi:hypothetical protein